MNTSSLCPFCFEPLTGNGPCSSCGHRVGEPSQGLQQLPVGWILDGKYRIGMTLGQGGFGITYLAYDMNLQQKIAIKEYFPGGLVTRSSQFVTPYTQSGRELFTKGVDAFYREGQLLARFQNHPNIVHIHNFFRENNSAYFVMEYVEGKSLAAYLDEKGGRLSQEETISLLTPVMDALDTLHQAGILHRDIAPDNIYLTKSGQVKLLDFGAAKNELSQHTHSSAAILKPGYAPLEQYSVTGNQGPWTDVYAMGAVIYRCLTGTMPPDAPDRITGKEILPISASGANVSKNVDTAVMKALALNISDRWQRMSELKNALSDPKIKIKKPISLNPNTVSNLNSKKKTTKRKSASFILIPALLIIGIGITWIVSTFMVPKIRYNNAIKLMDSGHYSEAIDIFTTLGAYKDSSQKIIECSREERFVYVIDLMSTGHVKDTLEAYSILSEFTDQANIEKAINFESDVLINTDSENAAVILDALNFSDAITLLDKIGEKNPQIKTTILLECKLQLQLEFQGIGDVVIFGKYEQDNNIKNGKEKIEWIILDKQGDMVLIVSKYCLDTKPYNSNGNFAIWNTSTLRVWLNKEFVNNAFSTEERKIIGKTTIHTEYQDDRKDAVKDTEDMVFLLSTDEAKQYFPSNSALQAKATDYAKANGAKNIKDDYSSWWLRSPTYYYYQNTFVNAYGYIVPDGSIVDSNNVSVRPALWIKP